MVVHDVVAPLIVEGKRDGSGGHNETETEFRIADGAGRRDG